MIIPGAQTQSFAAALAEATGEPLGQVEYEEFADGEQLVRVPEAVEGERAIITVSTVDSDAHIQLLQLQDAVREAGASEVVTVVPYIGYAWKTETFKAFDPISQRATARAISTETDRVIVVNPHNPEVVDHFDVPVTAVDAGGVLAKPLPDDLTRPVFLSPDGDSIEMAGTVRDTYGHGDADWVRKHQIEDPSNPKTRPTEVPIKDRHVVLVDDIIATGTTMSEAITLLKQLGASRIFATCIHPLFASNALTKLTLADVEAVYGTDTLERPATEVSAAPIVAEEL